MNFFELKQWNSFIKEAKLAAGVQKLSLNDAIILSKDIIKQLKLKYIDSNKITIDSTYDSVGENVAFPVGSIRRQKEEIGDIDLLCTSLITKEQIKNIPGIDRVVGGEKRLDFDYKGRRINLFFFSRNERESWGSALLGFTGPQVYNIRLRNLAKTKKNLKLSQNGLFDSKGNLIPTYSERDVQKRLGVTEREPHQR